LDSTPFILSVVPQTSLRGTSTFTVCLTGDYPGSVSPACLTWSSGVAPTPQTFSLINPPGNTGGNIGFTWSKSFAGSGMPGGQPDSYWVSLFVLPADLVFTRSPPRSQIDSTTIQWAMTFGPAPPAPNFRWNQGAAPGTGYGFFDFFLDWRHRADLMDSTALAAVGASPLSPPPTLLHPRQLGFAFGVWINMVSTRQTQTGSVENHKQLAHSRLPVSPVTSDDGCVLPRADDHLQAHHDADRGNAHAERDIRVRGVAELDREHHV
jgi:hypothetical protein